MIKVNIEKAKQVAHAVRRQHRAELFKPLDIEATIPMFAEAAETQRQKIRDLFAQHQEDIDKAEDVIALTSILSDIKA